jgi:hypothetical protein
VADLIDQLRAKGISFIYDPTAKTLRTEANAAVALSIG